MYLCLKCANVNCTFIVQVHSAIAIHVQYVYIMRFIAIFKDITRCPPKPENVMYCSLVGFWLRLWSGGTLWCLHNVPGISLFGCIGLFNCSTSYFASFRSISLERDVAENQTGVRKAGSYLQNIVKLYSELQKTKPEVAREGFEPETHA